MRSSASSNRAGHTFRGLQIAANRGAGFRTLMVAEIMSVTASQFRSRMQRRPACNSKMTSAGVDQVLGSL